MIIDIDKQIIEKYKNDKEFYDQVKKILDDCITYNKTDNYMIKELQKIITIQLDKEYMCKKIINEYVYGEDI